MIRAYDVNFINPELSVNCGLQTKHLDVLVGICDSEGFCKDVLVRKLHPMTLANITRNLFDFFVIVKKEPLKQLVSAGYVEYEDLSLSRHLMMIKEFYIVHTDDGPFYVWAGNDIWLQEALRRIGTRTNIWGVSTKCSTISIVDAERIELWR